MFTGIVQELGRLMSREDLGGDARLQIEVPAAVSERVRTGDSLAVNGVCLTVTEINDKRLSFDVSAETLSVTRLGSVEMNTWVNLEPAMSASDPVGGHFVTGHVDGVGKVVRVEEDGRSRRVEIEAPESLKRYIARKGCITVDGVSLTVNDVKGARFSFNVVPHTLSVTNMQDYAVGMLVHVEVDVIARYLERLLNDREAAPVEESITTDYLSQQGFTPPLTDDESEEDSDSHPEDGAPGPEPL